jgi:integrase
MDREQSDYERSPERQRQRAPDVLTPEEIMAFLKELPDPLRTMVELDDFTGLRRVELIGLWWQDVDFENLILHVRRSVVAMTGGAPKTGASLENGSFIKRCSARRSNGRISMGKEGNPTGRGRCGGITASPP